MTERFRDRSEAGRRLARALGGYAHRSDLVVLALPRGGVPIGHEVARALGAPLDVLVVRKLGAPGQEELAFGALASGGVRILNADVVQALGLTTDVMDHITAAETAELERRERTYRGERPRADVAARTVIVVDDGLATGSTMRAAVQALRALGPREIVVGVPVATPSACRDLEREADTVVCLETPEELWAISQAYHDFAQMSDAEVRALLDAAPVPRSATSAPRVTATPELLRAHARVLRGGDADYDELLHHASGARVVMIGEATHGSSEIYDERARLTHRLVRELGFDAVAIEGDWPDVYGLSRYVQGEGAAEDPRRGLRHFERFPTWMWRNEEVARFARELRRFNDERAHEERVGVFGIDLYSLSRSAAAVVRYLEEVDPGAAERARYRYGCFEDFGESPHDYGYAASFGLTPACEDGAVEQLVELQRAAPELLESDGIAGEDAYFFATQNARIVREAEAYYRTAFRSDVESWNLRDEHMMTTVENLLEHFSRRRGRPARLVVWAHNSHLGDARATSLSLVGERNLGQLARERLGGEAYLVGITTYAGEVAAASEWEGRVEVKRLRPALPESFEALFHDTELPAFWLPLRNGGELAAALSEPRLERAVGVVYRPESERVSHYFDARLAAQLDAVIHIDETRAVRPVEALAPEKHGEAETFPSGL